MFTKSIRWRLVLWLAFLLAGILSGFGITAYQLHRLNQLQQIDESLERRVSAVSAEIRGPRRFGELPDRPPFEPGPRRPGPRRFGPEPMGPPGPREFQRGPPEMRLSPQALSLFDETDTNSFYFAIWFRGGAPATNSVNAPTAMPVPALPSGDTRTHFRTRGEFREAFHFTEMGECVLAGRFILADLRGLRRFAWLLAGVGGGILALGLGGAWLLASRAIRPVDGISAAASRISAGNLSERINVAETDSELGRLAGVLNSTFARLESAFEEQKQFTADASHELRTPLAVIITEAQTALARERSAAEYRETVEGCLETAQQMRRLTESLLQLARLDAGQEIQRTPFDLAENARACVGLLRPLAASRGIQIHCALTPANAVGDAERMGQVITNLLHNAIHHSPNQGEIRVETQTEPNGVSVAVTDAGQGISAEDLPHIFERFYRADKSRSNASERSGLGLAICKAIVDAHGGRIEVASEPGSTTFTVWLPA